MSPRQLILSTLVWACLAFLASAEEQRISRSELLDKTNAFWVGQLVGNYMGFPFENIYVDEPVPFLVDRYYSFRDDPSIRLHRDDHRSYFPILAGMFEGAYSDDDTDIEFVTLHAVEKHGLDLDYAEITGMWKRHINRKIWAANRSARDLMEQGMIAPDTGSRDNNENWFQIDSQLVNEIWSAFHPGMPRQAAARAEWGARITNDDWGTHPTIAYAAMYSAAYFEMDVDKLVAIARAAIPNEGPFSEGMDDVVRWHREYPDWRDTRRHIHERYYRYDNGTLKAPASIISSLPNGLCGIMAILYGEGDFMKTVGIATSAGYDCDNQAATCAGLIGVRNGMAGIPEGLTKLCRFGEQSWDKPFNDTYINFSRDGLPIKTRISDLAERTVVIAEKAILGHGGRKLEENGKTYYLIPKNASPPKKVSAFLERPPEEPDNQ